MKKIFYVPHRHHCHFPVSKYTQYTHTHARTGAQVHTQIHTHSHAHAYANTHLTEVVVNYTVMTKR